MTLLNGVKISKSQHKIASPTGKEVLVKVTAAGLCHSDLHIRKGFMDLGSAASWTLCREAQPALNARP